MQRIAVMMLFITVTLTWGTTWLAMQIAVETIPPLFATGLRFMFAAPVLTGIALVTGAPLLFPRGQRMFQVAVSFFYFLVPFTLMIYGEKYVSSGLASVIFSAMPAAVLLASVTVLKEKAGFAQLTGLILALGSLAAMLIRESASGFSCRWQGMLALSVAVLMHAFMYATCKKRGCQVPVVTFNAMPCLVAGIVLLLVGWEIECPNTESFSVNSLLCLLWLGCFAGVSGILCYFFLQKKAGSFNASLVFLLFPVVALWLENRIYGHAVSAASLWLLLPLAAGIFLILTPSQPAERRLNSGPAR